MVKVLHVLNTNTYSGAENVVCQIISICKKNNGYEMYYCSQDGPVREQVESKGISFYPLSQPLNVDGIKKVIRTLQPDIIHAHDMKASYVCSRACGHIPLISHIHNNDSNSRRISIKSLAYFFAAKKAVHIFWVSNSSFKGYFFNGSFKEKSSILYNIIDVDALYKRMNEDKKTYNYDIIYLGRLNCVKNPHRLLDVCKLVVDKKKNLKVAIVGNGEMEEEIKNRASKMGLSSNITFFGFQPNPLKILHDSKIMLMTSLNEGTPMCALEAMALGVPIVSTPVDGLIDLVKNNQNGFLFNDDEELANQIVRLLCDPDLLKKLSDNQIEKAAKWNNIDFYFKEIISAYQKAMGK